MNQQDDKAAEKTESLGDLEVRDEPLADLPVAASKAELATGGSAPTGRIYVATNVGVFLKE